MQVGWLACCALGWLAACRDGAAPPAGTERASVGSSLKVTPPTAVAQPPTAQPSLPPPASGVPACDSYVLEYRAFLDRCASQLGDELAALRQNVEAQVATYAAWDRLDDATRAATVAAAAPGCVAATASLHARAAALNCSKT